MYLIAFEIDSTEAVKELNTEHGWKTWTWSTAVRMVRDYFAECVEMARPGISPKIDFQILHTDVAIDQWFKDGDPTMFRLIDYVESRSTFQNKVMDDWFDNALHRERYVLTLLASVGGDVGYDKMWDRLIANSLKWRGNVSVIHLQNDNLDLSTLDHASNKLLGTAVGDHGYRVDPQKIDLERSEVLGQVEFFNRIFKELRRREEIRRQAEAEQAAESEDTIQTYTIELESVGNKVSASRVIANQFSIPVSEALSSLKELPITLAEGATLEEAQEFKGLLEAARARVKLIPE
jgi:ribosomal protein L7/L12